VPAGRIAALAAPLLDLLYPPSCSGCGGPVPCSEVRLCSQCIDSLPWLGDSGCSRCGSELDKGSRCQLCRHLDSSLAYVRSAVWFAGCVPELVHELKYARRQEMAPLMSELALACGALRGLLRTTDLIVPVPLHWRRKVKRGFNQSDLLAAGLSELTGIAAGGSGVVRSRATATQTRLNPEQRRNNVAGAFVCREKERIQDKSILIVDDVMTTGATLGEVARSLAVAGARRVFGWTFARA
jgi:competence protein ComFC